jgi:eukaryotic-like serine/threonine-protein kinase
MDTTLSRLQAGQLLNSRYRVGSWIARGGMATVYLGTDTKLDRTVALKIAHPELVGDRDFVRRFSIEARAAARLSSPHVVAVYDTGSDSGLLYMAMEYVPGRTLRELLIERGRLGPAEALGIFTSVLSGLAAAHDAGIVHRDVKPENVLIGSNGTVKVADFGLARAASMASNTKTGMIIGTAAYLAPEQVARSTSDERTDVYAAGIMLFEMLTGTQPYKGDSPLAVAQMHVSQSVPAPSRLVRGLPQSLDALVGTATSRDPGHRPPNAGVYLRAVTDVSRELDAVLSAPTAGQRPTGLAALGLAGGDYRTARLGPPGDRRGPDGDRRGPDSDRRGPDEEWFPWQGPGEDAAAGHGGRRDDGAHRTLVVPDGFAPGDRGYGYPDPRGGGYPPAGEDSLRSRLTRPKVVYSALAVAAVLIIAVVTWWVSDGQYAAIPQVGGMAASTAQTELQNLGFTVQVGKGVHSSVAQGDVVRTRPSVGSSVHQGSTVTIIESLGPLMISVPQVSGLQQAAAEAALKQAGLKVGTVTGAASSSVPAGEVISTTPASGTSWPQSKPVSLLVSQGPPLPNLVGDQVADAQAQAQSGNFQLQQVTATSSNEPQGTIVGQSPAAGTPITPGEVVTVNVSSGPPEVAVPDVQGLSEQQAMQELQAAGFAVQVTGGGVFGGNTVQSYSPTGQAPQGATITIDMGGFSFP